MAKVIKVEGGYVVYCPGCKSNHFYDKRWTFNNDFEKPTFRPSYLRRSGHYMPEHKGNECWCNYSERFPNDTTPVPESMKCMRCHTYITDGKIQYLSDCSHKLVGQTIEIPDMEDTGGETDGL